MPKKTWPHNLTAQERVDRARALVSRQIDDLISLIAISESNRLLIYSPLLASQIPTSYAANAFNLLQSYSINYEVVRACVLWDSPREDRASIPTVMTLVASHECRSILERDLGGTGFYATQHMRNFDRAVQVANLVLQSNFKRALFDLRNRDLAHSLMLDKPSLKVKYGYERKLLRASVAVVSNLNHAIRNSDFLFEDTVMMSKRNANALWGACKFHIVD